MQAYAAERPATKVHYQACVHATHLLCNPSKPPWQLRPPERHFMAMTATRQMLHTWQYWPEVVSVVRLVVSLMAALRLGKGWALAASAEQSATHREATTRRLAIAGLRSRHPEISGI
jgi:hypothetical protein